VVDALPAPEPAAGTARVRLAFAGVNFIDVYFRTGLYDAGPLPARVGREGSGVVDAVGPGVDRSWIGRPVAFCDAVGSYAESVSLPIDRLLPLPDAMPLEIGAALPLQGMTADYLVRTIGRVAPGDQVLVHAAAGGVGLLAVQLARLAGATVYGTCSTPAKAAAARAAGCAAAILYGEEDFAAVLLEATDGRGVDLVLDSVGKATFRDSVRATRTRGTVVVFGQSSGPIEPFSPRAVLGSRTLVSASLFDYVRDPTELAERWARVAAEQVAGRLAVAVDRILPLEQAAEAHRLLEGRATSGKLLLAVG
jgi:NADPH2:quinone reductase